MLLSFLCGTVFGAVLFFMARIADKKTEPILERLVTSQRSSQPIILEPDEVTKEERLRALQERLNSGE